MNFNTNEELNSLLNSSKLLGFGSQGTCYLNNSDKTVYKIFHAYDEVDLNSQTGYFENEILKFSNIKNKTFIWPTDVIKVNGKIIGYKSNYVKAKNLCELNPLSISLNKLCKCISIAKKDIKTISEKGVLTYDIMYNILYNANFYVIDQDYYKYSDKASSILLKENNNNFDLEIYYFLIDYYFNNLVNDNRELKELYKYKNEDILIFIKLLRKHLSELVGTNINYLKDAKKYMDKEHKSCSKYERLKILI